MIIIIVPRYHLGITSRQVSLSYKVEQIIKHNRNINLHKNTTAWRITE